VLSIIALVNSNRTRLPPDYDRHRALLEGVNRRVDALAEAQAELAQRLDGGPAMPARAAASPTVAEPEPVEPAALDGEKAAPEDLAEEPEPEVPAPGEPVPEEAEAGEAPEQEQPSETRPSDERAAETGPWAMAPAAQAPARVGRTFDWERMVGIRLPIWLGAITLSVAAFFLVVYTVEAGLLTPWRRVFAGIAGGAAGLAGAEYVLRRMRTGNAGAIAAALASAAVTAFYVSGYAAATLFELVPPSFGFAAMGVTTFAAIAISLRFGWVVVIVALFGGNLTPLLIRTTEPNEAVFFAYLLAIFAAAFIVMDRRGWPQLTLTTLIGPAIWIGVYAMSGNAADSPLWITAFLIALPSVTLAVRRDQWLKDTETATGLRQPGAKSIVARAAGDAIGAAMVLAAAGFVGILIGADHPWPVWQGFMVFAGATVALSLYRPNALWAMPLYALAAAAVAVLIWQRPGETELLVVLAILFAIFAFGAVAHFVRLQRPALWGMVVAFVGLFFYLAAVFKFAGWEAARANPHAWAAAALALAVGLTALLARYGPAVAEGEQRSRVYAALAAAVTALVSMAVVLELDPLVFPAATAAQVLALSILVGRTGERGLEWVAWVYFAVYAVLILASASGFTGLQSYFLAQAVARPFWDAPIALLILPALGFVVAATLLRPVAATPLPHYLDGAFVPLAAVGIGFVVLDSWTQLYGVRAYVNGASFYNAELLFLSAVLAAGGFLGRRVLAETSAVLVITVALMMVSSYLLPLLVGWPHARVSGNLFINILPGALVLPAILLLGTTYWARTIAVRAMPRPISLGLRFVAVMLVFLAAVIWVRFGYHARALYVGATSDPENYTYSIVTLVFGIGLLVLGTLVNSRLARALSFGFFLAAAIKTFLFDAAQLDGLLRVASFIGLGLSFLGISWFYARFVFRFVRGGEAEPPSEEAELADN